jgi:tetratricopeptide (TPR) repeat protein
MKRSPNGFRFWLALAVLAGWLPWAAGQSLSANLYYQQCLRLEASGDLVNARQSCLNALEVDGSLTNASLALARVDLALGNLAAAESRLNDVRRRAPNAEVFILLGEAALLSGRLDEAESHLATARTRLAENFNNQLESRLNYLTGRLDEARSDYQRALINYRNAVISDGLNLRYRMSLATLLYRLGDLVNARAELEDYQQFTGNTRNPELLSLLGHIQWSQGDFNGAISSLETAVTLRGSRNPEAQSTDLFALARIYYGQGEIRLGAQALRAALREGSILLNVLSSSLFWLLSLVVLLAIHLIGESRFAASTTLVAADGPAMWSMTHVYGAFFVSVLVGAIIAFIYGLWRYDNYLAVLTPVQSADVQALFLAITALFLTGFAFFRVRQFGWDPAEVLLGVVDHIPLGILTGLGMLALAIGFQYLVGSNPIFAGFYLTTAQLTPTVAAAALLLPLSELFFRAFLIPPLKKRYDALFAVLISALLYGLLLGTPVLLLLAFGYLLSTVFIRTNSGINTVVASLVFHLGLLVAVAFIPFVRGIFFAV